MLLALRAERLKVEKDFPLQAKFRGRVVGEFKVDLLVNGSVLNFGPRAQVRRLVLENERKGPFFASACASVRST